MISGEKDRKHVLMQKVVTLNTCSDVESSCHTSQLVLFRATYISRNTYNKPPVR